MTIQSQMRPYLSPSPSMTLMIITTIFVTVLVLKLLELIRKKSSIEKKLENFIEINKDKLENIINNLNKLSIHLNQASQDSLSN